MIERILIENFKTFAKADMALGRVNVLIGANGSGKSNFIEAMRVVQGRAMGLANGSLLNGDPSRNWPGVRGGAAHALWDDGQGDRRFAISGIHRGRAVERGEFEYVTTLNGIGSAGHTTAQLNADLLAALTVEQHREESRTEEELVRDLLGRMKGNLANLGRDSFAVDEVLGVEFNGVALNGLGYLKNRLGEIVFRDELGEMQFLDLDPERLRDYAAADVRRRMGERGEGFPLVVEGVLEDAHTKEAYLSWLRELTPERVENVAVLSGEDQSERRFAIVENGKKISARILSDGTLRFAGLVAAFFQKPQPEVLLIEDVETGLHPARLRLLMEMFVRLSAQAETQVIVSTHSPLLVDWAVAFDCVNIFVCLRKKSGATEIVPIESNTQWQRIKSSGRMGEFFAEGGMESA